MFVAACSAISSPTSSRMRGDELQARSMAPRTAFRRLAGWVGAAGELVSPSRAGHAWSRPWVINRAYVHSGAAWRAARSPASRDSSSDMLSPGRQVGSRSSPIACPSCRITRAIARSHGWTGNCGVFLLPEFIASGNVTPASRGCASGAKHGVGFVIMGKDLAFRIPLDLAAQPDRDVCQVTYC